MDNGDAIEVEVAYALRTRQVLLRVRVPPGATIGTAIRQSGMLELFPEIDLPQSKVGIFGRRVNLGQVIRDGDRIEIYRPLIADPKVARRARAQIASTKKIRT